MSATEYQARQPHLLSQLAQRVATDELRAGVGEKTLTLAGEMVVDDMADNGIKQCIA